MAYWSSTVEGVEIKGPGTTLDGTVVKDFAIVIGGSGEGSIVYGTFEELLSWCDEVRKALEDAKPWAVVDTESIGPDGCHIVMGRFATHDEGADYILTLPDFMTGRYGLDGPPEA